MYIYDALPRAKTLVDKRKDESYVDYRRIKILQRYQGIHAKRQHTDE
jgi:hypothetical protein